MEEFEKEETLSISQLATKLTKKYSVIRTSIGSLKNKQVLSHKGHTKNGYWKVDANWKSKCIKSKQ